MTSLGGNRLGKYIDNSIQKQHHYQHSILRTKRSSGTDWTIWNSSC